MKFLFLILITSIYVCCSHGRKSFSLVLDTTETMDTELSYIKRNLNGVLTRDLLSEYEKFTMIVFNDRYVSPPIIYNDPMQLLHAVNNVSPYNGKNCPEDSVQGIKKAVETSNQDSTVYVFTDASAHTGSSSDDIASLCAAKNVRVIIFLTGDCSEADTPGDLQIYTDIVNACSGNILKLYPTELGQAFKFIELMMKNSWTDVTVETFSGYKDISVTEDWSETVICILYNGANSTFQSENKGFRNIIDLNNVRVKRIKNEWNQQYSYYAGCEGTTTITTYKRVSLELQFGFAPRRPVVPSMTETSNSPRPGQHNFILVNVLNENLKLNSLNITFIEQNENINVPIEEISERKYLGGAHFQPYKKFIITVHGKNTKTHKSLVSTSNVMVPQTMRATPTRFAAPFIEILPLMNTTILYQTQVGLVCTVQAFPQPYIWWENEKGERFDGEIHNFVLPVTYISYLVIQEFTESSRYYCKSRNSAGVGTKAIELFVYRPNTLEVIEQLQDTTLEFSNEGQLKCHVVGYPEPTVKWYHNQTEIDFDTNKHYVKQEDGILILNMTLETVGQYRCFAENLAKSETMDADVKISGLDIPEVSLTDEVIANLGDWKSIICSVDKGSPAPVITWSYKSNEDEEFSTELPEGVYIDKKEMKITSVTKTHAGIYKCAAENFLGEDSKDVKLEVQYAPTIGNEMKDMEIVQGNYARFECDVDAVPKAVVKWSFVNDVNEPLDSSHSADENNTLTFQALRRDAGTYECYAENKLGKAEKSFALEVLVEPLIRADSLTVVKRVGELLMLNCDVVAGYPTPTVKWLLPSTMRQNSNQPIYADNPIYYERVEKKHEGKYTCIAENKVNLDRVTIEVKVY